MNLESDDLCDLQHLAKQFGGGLAMLEQGGGVDVSLTTVSDVAIEGLESLEGVKLPIF